MNGIFFGIISLRNSFSLESARTWLLLVATITLVGIAYLGQATEATVTGQRVHDLQDRLDRIERQNAQLEYQIAALISPDKIEARAKALGLRPVMSNQVQFVNEKDYAVAASHSASAQSPGETASSASSGGWWDTLAAQLRALFNSPAEATPDR